MYEGVAIVDAHGNEEAQNLLPLFEDYLAKPTPENELLGDRMRQGAVVFLGTLASHMESGNPKVFFPTKYVEFLSSTRSPSSIMEEVCFSRDVLLAAFETLRVIKATQLTFSTLLEVRS